MLRSASNGADPLARRTGHRRCRRRLLGPPLLEFEVDEVKGCHHRCHVDRPRGYP
jgi:hypothetical protein